MTLSEVKSATANLVFAEELADLDTTAEAGFFGALARAIWTTDALRPTRRILWVHHTPPYPDAVEVGSLDVLYDLRRYASDIASVVGAPALVEDGTPIALTSDFVISGAHFLFLSRTLSGDVRVCCRIRPTVPTVYDDPDTALSLDEELCQLLPLLTAHYLLLDDDPEKANHYLSLYREQYALLKTEDSLPTPVKWRSVNNW